MNKNDAEQWKSQNLTWVLRAFAEHPALRSILVFKGARILNLRLNSEDRQSLDIDSSLDVTCLPKGTVNEQAAYLQKETDLALRKLATQENPLVRQVEFVRVEVVPKSGTHPFGWMGFLIRIRLKDNALSGERGLPTLEIDVAAHEPLGTHAVSDLSLGAGLTVRAYTVERIAGEKMRAFLTSLPAYKLKTGRRADTVRVKDLYDLTRIARVHPLDSDVDFWRHAGEEFRMACESRYVDCAGIVTFGENLAMTRKLYESPIIPHDIPFETAWQTIGHIVTIWEKAGVIPLSFALPQVGRPVP